MDAQTGQVQNVREWPTASDRARITPAPAGRFVVITPDELILYSTKLERIKLLPLYLSRSAELSSFSPQASPAGTYLLIKYEFPNGIQVGYKWVALQNLTMLKEWDYVDVSRRSTGSISDEGKTINSLQGRENGIGVPGTDPADSPCPPTDPTCLRGFFVSDDRLFYLNRANREGRSDIRLIRTDATLVLDQELRNDEVLAPPNPIVGEETFAIAIYKGHGGSGLLDIAPHLRLEELRVYDSEFGRRLFTLDGKSQKIRSLSAFALSSGGSLLALIDQNGILRLYTIE